LSSVSSNPVTFDWATAAGTATAGTDYVAASGSRTIAAGATTATFGITVNGDLVDEANETYGITLSNPGNATIADGSGVGTITDDDAAPTLSVNDVTVAEGNAGATTATFAVTVNGDVTDEFDETFGITLSNPGNATIADGSGLGTITDDDAAP